ncbi:MAG: tetratricopeptide repeat protein [Myxococcales bacterium]|nr:tetratricopeptide repeat protein [Myxococcales bacterium]
MLQKGELTLKDYHAISGPEMLQMALIGFRMYENGKYSEAETIFNGLIALDPREAYYYTALGAVFLAQDEFERAKHNFDTALVFNPKELAAYVNRGEVHLRMGNVMEAATDFKSAVDLDPSGKDPLVIRARVLAAAALELIENAQGEGDAKKEPAKKAEPAKKPAPAKKK